MTRCKTAVQPFTPPPRHPPPQRIGLPVPASVVRAPTVPSGAQHEDRAEDKADDRADDRADEASAREMGGGHDRGGHARGGYANFGRTTGAFDLRGSRAAGRARREAVGLRVSPELNGLAVANVMGRASLASAESVSKWQARRQHATATQPPRNRRVTATATPLDDHVNRHVTTTQPPHDRHVIAV